jgi:hypothetical protein
MCLITGMKLTVYIALLTVILVYAAPLATAEVTVTVSAQKYAALPGDVFPVVYTVYSSDGDEDFVVLPPELPALEWGTANVMDLHAADREIRFTVGYRADTAGAYTVPGLTIRLAKDLDPATTAITKLEDATPTQVVETDPVQVVFRKPRIALWIGGIVLVLLVVAGLVTFRLRTSGNATLEDPGLSPLEQAQERLHDARRSRLDGDFYAFYRALHSALTCMAAHSPEPHTALREKIKRAIDDTGYRGMRPSDDVLEGDFRDVERIVAQEQQRAAKEN